MPAKRCLVCINSRHLQHLMSAMALLEVAMHAESRGAQEGSQACSLARLRPILA